MFQVLSSRIYGALLSLRKTLVNEAGGNLMPYHIMGCVEDSLARCQFCLALYGVFARCAFCLFSLNYEFVGFAHNDLPTNDDVHSCLQKRRAGRN